MASASNTNSDLTQLASVRTGEMEWTPSPMPNVWRKRMFHTGGDESGRVTSVVKYGPGSSFRSHPHPEGEEIFVLEGTFSDINGDHKAGTLLLNPEGFEHAPSSEEGCVILVRLRQYPGDRPQTALDTNKLHWEPTEHAGPGSVQSKALFKDPRFGDSIELQQWAPATEVTLQASHGVEMFVVSGSCQSTTDGSLSFPTHSWLRVPADSPHSLRSEDGCQVYLKYNALPLAAPLVGAA